MVHRPQSHLEWVGERLFQVVKDHANDTEPTLALIGEICWALDLYPRFYVVDPPERKDGA
jgi:hypothetical protein